MKVKSVLLLLPILTLFSPNAFAMTALKQVQVSNGTEVDLLFDGKVSKSQIKTEFFNDVIQISLTDVSVYPAKISSVNGGALTKIFAYQYAPKLVRCRLSVKGKAEDYRGKLVIQPSGPSGRMLTVRLSEGAQPLITGKTTDQARAHSADAPVNAPVNAEEKALLDHVMKSTAPEGISDRIVEKAAAPVAPSGSSQTDSSENQPIHFSHDSPAHSDRLTGAGTKIPSLLSVFAKLMLVIGIFSAVALAFKKFWKGKAEANTALFGALGKFARTSLRVKGTSPKLGIEVVANHHLGPKKSIAIVRVGGRTLVVGITEQAINLITNLSIEEDTEEGRMMNAIVEMENPPLDDAGPILDVKPSAGATAAGPAVFAKVLQGEARKPSVGAKSEFKPQPQRTEPKKDIRVTGYGTNLTGVTGVTGNGRAPSTESMSAQAALGLSGVRAQIKNKLEGLKTL